MLRRIELKNFMSHRHTVIEPAPGLTVLVGPNNCGKSALVAALQILCNNDLANYVTRHGARECSVEVETSEGHVIRWSRKNSPSYRINGQLFDRLGKGGLPDELHPLLRLPQVEAGDGTGFGIHFGCQKSPIFLLDQAPAAAAKFFASSSDATRLVEMQRRHRDKHQEKQKEKSRLEAESQQLNAELTALQPTAEIDQRLREAESLHQQLGSLATALLELSCETARISALATQVNFHQSQVAVLSELADPPQLAMEQPLVALRGLLAEAYREQQLAASRAAVLQALSAPPEYAATQELSRCGAELQALLDAERRFAAVHTALQPLRSPPACEQTAELQSLLVRLQGEIAAMLFQEEFHGALGQLQEPPRPEQTVELESCLATLHKEQASIQRLSSGSRVLETLGLPPQPLPAEPLAYRIEELRSFTEQADSLQRHLNALHSEHAAILGKIRDLASDQACPTCGAPLDPERLLSFANCGGKHGHG